MVRKTVFVFALTFSASAAFAGLSSTDVEDKLPSVSTGASTGAAAGAAATLETQQGKSRFSRFMNDVSFAYFNITNAPMNRANEGAARLEAYNYVSFDYRLSREQKISIRPVFYWGTAGHNFFDDYEAGDFSLGDAYVSYKHRLGEIIPYSDARVSATMRVYAPTSKESESRGMIARLRPLVEIEKRLTRDWTLSLELEPDYYLQGRTAFVERGKVKTNRNAGYESLLSLEYRINRWVSAGGGVGHAQMWHHTSSENGQNDIFRTESFSNDASLNFSLGKVFMVAGVSQKRDLARPKGDYEFFNPSESEYYLLTNINF